MDSGVTEEKGVVFVSADLTAYDLPVVHANAQEQTSHDDVIAQIDKSTGGKALWKSVV